MTDSVALLMSDTRLPGIGGVSDAAAFSLKNISAFALAFYLNQKHACIHHEQLLLFRLPPDGCDHPRWGRRHPSYCKLPAIAEALARGFSTVVFLDSDAFIRDASLSLPALLRRYRAAAASASEEEPSAEFGWDSPYSLGPNAGFAVFRNVPATWEALRVWWNLQSLKGVTHPYEQDALHWALLHLCRFRRSLSTLALRTMDPAYPDAVVHLDHNAGRKTRVWIMARAAAEVLLSSGAPDSAAAMSTRLQRWLPVLRAQRGDLRYGERMEAVHAVVHAIRADLAAMHATHADAPLPRTLTSTSTTTTATAAAVAAARQSDWTATAHHSGCRAPVIEELNATEAAMRLLTWTLPVPNASQRHAPSHSPSGQHSRRVTRQEQLSQALIGLPLLLLNCTTSRDDGRALARWQTWHVVRGGASNAATGGGGGMPGGGMPGEEAQSGLRFALAAAPTLCLAMGETRSPRNPYAPLATLMPCASSAADARRQQLRQTTPSNLASCDGRVAIAPQRTWLWRVPTAATPTAASAASGPHMLQTAPQETLRRTLPELRAGCGFWPACSGTRTVVPKPCWAQLHTNSSACGQSEPSIRNLVSRASWAGHSRAAAAWSSLTVGPSGPVATAALRRGGADRLCLSTWRTQLSEGSAATFMRCPRQPSNNASAARTNQRKTHRGRWDGGGAFEWQLGEARRRQAPAHSRRGSATAHTLQPRAAPGLCLSAPAIHHRWLGL